MHRNTTQSGGTCHEEIIHTQQVSIQKSRSMRHGSQSSTSPVFLLAITAVRKRERIYIYIYINVSSNIEMNTFLCLKKNMNVSRPSEHAPVRGETVKTFRLHHRPQRQTFWGAVFPERSGQTAVSSPTSTPIFLFLDAIEQRCCCRYYFSHSTYWMPTRKTTLHGRQSRSSSTGQ